MRWPNMLSLTSSSTPRPTGTRSLVKTVIVCSGRPPRSRTPRAAGRSQVPLGVEDGRRDHHEVDARLQPPRVADDLRRRPERTTGGAERSCDRSADRGTCYRSGRMPLIASGLACRRHRDVAAGLPESSARLHIGNRTTPPEITRFPACFCADPAIAQRPGMHPTRAFSCSCLCAAARVAVRRHRRRRLPPPIGSSRPHLSRARPSTPLTGAPAGNLSVSSAATAP